MNEKTAETATIRPEDNFAELADPMTLLFRVYNVGENFDDICRMFQNALTVFCGCDKVQIQIEAPPRAIPPASRAEEEGRALNEGGQIRILGFAG